MNGKKEIDMEGIKYEILWFYDYLYLDHCDGDGKCIMKPDALAGINAKEYDCIILATINPAYKFEMRNNLKDMGIADEIIISCCE